MKKNKKGGRPRKDAAEKLKYKVTIKLCTQDYYSLKAAARTAGMRPATLARLALTGVRIKPRITPEEAGWMRSLSGIANNLNQLARRANKEGYAEHRDVNLTLAREIVNLIKHFRDDGKDNKG